MFPGMILLFMFTFSGERLKFIPTYVVINTKIFFFILFFSRPFKNIRFNIMFAHTTYNVLKDIPSRFETRVFCTKLFVILRLLA